MFILFFAAGLLIGGFFIFCVVKAGRDEGSDLEASYRRWREAQDLDAKIEAARAQAEADAQYRWVD